MKMNKKLLLASTVALSALPLLTTRAEEQPQNWTARTVEQIKADITSNENQQTYTVQYGDTLGNIAQAMNIDLVDLAKINQIANADLIFPGTVLTITTNGAQRNYLCRNPKATKQAIMQVGNGRLYSK